MFAPRQGNYAAWCGARRKRLELASEFVEGDGLLTLTPILHVNAGHVVGLLALQAQRPFWDGLARSRLGPQKSVNQPDGCAHDFGGGLSVGGTFRGT